MLAFSGIILFRRSGGGTTRIDDRHLCGLAGALQLPRLTTIPALSGYAATPTTLSATPVRDVTANSRTTHCAAWVPATSGRLPRNDNSVPACLP